jgi:hypothetical protein
LTRLIDTPGALYFLGGRLAEGLPDGEYAISVITEMELLSYPGLDRDAGEEAKAQDALSSVAIVRLG